MTPVRETMGGGSGAKPYCTLIGRNGNCCFELVAKDTQTEQYSNQKKYTLSTTADIVSTSARNHSPNLNRVPMTRTNLVQKQSPPCSYRVP